jgi:hypothetical protein
MEVEKTPIASITATTSGSNGIHLDFLLMEPSNQSRFKKGSGLTKKAALGLLASQFSNRTAQKISDKYNNIKRAHSKSA